MGTIEKIENWTCDNYRPLWSAYCYICRFWYGAENKMRDFRGRLQRFHRGWADEDVWSMDHSLAQIIVPMLKELRENNVGYPHGLTEKKWEDILDKMIVGFQSVLDENEVWIKKLTNDQHKKILETEHKKQQEGLKLFARYYRNLWD